MVSRRRASGRSWTWKQVFVSIAVMWAVAIPWAFMGDDGADAQASPAPSLVSETVGQAACLAPPDGGEAAVGSTAGSVDWSDEAQAIEACKGKMRPDNEFEQKAMTELTLGDWLQKFAPILILLLVVALVIARLPKLDLGHSPAYRRRRVMNWLPLGLTYAFLYMARYNINVAKTSLGADMGLTNEAFAIIFGVGTVTYGVSFLINGPLTDKLGGKFAILLGAAGAMVANILMGVVVLEADRETIIPMLTVLYAINMYFQSFGAVAIVKVNAPWFHVRERGVFGAIFGILISLGVYFAYDWNQILVDLFPGKEFLVFFVPAGFLALFFLLDVMMVRNTPGQAGHRDFNTADASSGDTSPRLPVIEVFRMMFRNKIIVTIALIEFCSGYLRQAIMQWYKPYAKAIEEPDLLIGWVYQNWGLLLCCAGILGGVVAGIISDRVFQSRRGPVAALLYGLMIVGAIVGMMLIDTPFIGFLVVVMSIFIIGVHGMLSGTASMDFGGAKNVGIAVGIIDGFVYLGTGLMSLVYGIMLPKGVPTGPDCVRPDQDPANWMVWPMLMLPFAIIGFLLAMRIWHAMPKGKEKKKGAEAE